ncbi:unnamed protein product, partial [Pylaiella littoralis]
ERRCFCRVPRRQPSPRLALPRQQRRHISRVATQARRRSRRHARRGRLLYVIHHAHSPGRSHSDGNGFEPPRREEGRAGQSYGGGV